MMKNILIYDRTHAYKSFLRKNFTDVLNIEDFNKFEDVNEINFNEYEAVFFVLSEEIELVDLMLAYSKFNNLFLSSKFKKINNKLQDIENVFILDFNKNKKDILADIRFYLNLYETSLQLKKMETI
jgi:hypothetical protein